MTDLEITTLCAKAMGHAIGAAPSAQIIGSGGWEFDPLHDDAQAMALEDWLIEQGGDLSQATDSRLGRVFNYWHKSVGHFGYLIPFKEARRRAICECVARMSCPGLGDGCQNPDVSVEQGGGAAIALPTRIVK